MPRKIADVIKRIKNKYDEDPEDWRVYGGQDPSGNQDIFIQHAPKIWQIKYKPINPLRSVAFGSPVRRLDDEINARIGAPPDSNDLLRLFGMMVPVSRDENIVASGVQQFSQAKTRQIKDSLREKTPNQERNLREEIDKEFTKHFPGRKNLYV